MLLEGDVAFDGEAGEAHARCSTQRATAVYLPPGSSVVGRRDARRGDRVHHDARLRPRRRPARNRSSCIPTASSCSRAASPGWQRDVHDVIADAVPARHLLVGETFNEPGQWSSFPPHKHDGADGEPALEEVYYYRFDRPDGFGFQGLYEADGEAEAVFLRARQHRRHPARLPPRVRGARLPPLLPVGARRRAAPARDARRPRAPLAERPLSVSRPPTADRDRSSAAARRAPMHRRRRVLVADQQTP